MSDGGADAAPIGTAGLDGASAGSLLRAAREKRGLHIAALAASIKVAPRKLEALEADRYAELPDMTFTRALAQTVCRALKIDAEPVLAKLPQVGNLSKLAQLGDGLNTPFRAAPGGRDPADFNFHRTPVFWATLLVLIGALALAVLPDRWMPWRGSSPAPTAAPVPASGAAAAAPAGSAAVPSAMPAASMPFAADAIIAQHATTLGAASAPAASAQSPAFPPVALPASPPAAAAASDPATAVPAGILAVRTRADSWVQVQDSRGQMLLARTVRAGETVALDGDLPLRVVIGNAAVTEIVFRGQAVDLAPSTRDNIARLQLPQR